MNLEAIFKRGPIVFPLACAAAVTMVVISEGSHWQSAHTLHELSELAQMRSSIRDLQIGLLDAESGQRGYLLTGREEYLQPYGQGLAGVDESFRVLDAYYAAQPQARGLLAAMHAQADARRAELAHAMRLQATGQAEEARRVFIEGSGKGHMEAMRSLGAELLGHERQAFAESQADLSLTLQRSRFGVALLSAIGLLAMYFFLRQSRALKEHQAELKRVVQAEHDRLEIEVAQRTAQLTELTHHLQTAREDERQRLARDLHDELGALLTGAKLDAARIKSRLGDTAPEALERLADLVGKLNSGIALGRRIIEDLRPSTLSHLGLVATLEIQAREFAVRSGLEAHCSLAPVPLDATAELVVYRLVQEAITNITKYAKARQVWLGMSTEGAQVEVTVRDDGVGFDTTAKPSSAYGLLGMRFRVEAEGGTLDVVSALGKGTLIRVRLPIDAAAEAPPA